MRSDSPKVGQVLEELVVQLGEQTAAPDRIIVQQSTPHVFVCRVYMRIDEDYDAYELRF